MSSVPNTNNTGTISSNDDDNAMPPPFHRVIPARPKRKTEKTILPVDYEPSRFSVICGRGKGSYQSDGNVHFRALVKSNLERYKEAPGRLEKSFIVSEVLNMIRESCPLGAFVKYEKGRWYDLDDTVCREKVGSLFRDFLHTDYKSSSKAKHAKKVAEKSQGKPTDGKKAPKQPAAAKQKSTTKSDPPAQSKQRREDLPTSIPRTTVAGAIVVAQPQVTVQQPVRVPARPGQQPVVQRPGHQLAGQAVQQPKQKQVPSNETDEPPTFYDIDDLSLSKLV